MVGPEYARRRMRKARGRTTYYPVELGTLVALGPALGLVLACAELPEVLGCSGHDIFKQLEGYPA
jgi:hypothetical protein